MFLTSTYQRDSRDGADKISLNWCTQNKRKTVAPLIFYYSFKVLFSITTYNFLTNGSKLQHGPSIFACLLFTLAQVMWDTCFLKFNTYSIIVYIPNKSSSNISLKNTSTLYRKCLATSTGLLFSRLLPQKCFATATFLQLHKIVWKNTSGELLLKHVTLYIL